MEKRKTYIPLKDNGDPLAPSKWMYAPSYPADLFVVEGRWVHALMQLGFRTLTVSKVSRRVKALWKQSHFVNRDEFRERINTWLREEEYPLIVSRRRLDYVFSGDERAEINDLFVMAIAAAFDRPVGKLFAERGAVDNIGVYRCMVVLTGTVYHRIYLAPSVDAATQRCILDLLIGPSRVTAQHGDWFKATVECVELKAWKGGIAIEDLVTWVGHIGMKLVDTSSQAQPSRISDEPP
jgi:hypothetical protein